MSDDPPLHPGSDLLDDFYAECDELFGHMHAQLAALESASADAAAALDGFYRSVHSFKGICGIVGLRVAEQLAHATEEVLRALTSRRATPSDDVLRLLARTLNRWEQIVSAHRLGQTLPAIEDLFVPLNAFRAAPAAPGAGVPAPVPAAEAASAGCWRARFSPSESLDRRGVNVTSIRKRLAAVGVLEKAEPRIEPDGRMFFDFAVRLNDPAPADVDAWRRDGVEFFPPPRAGADKGVAAVPPPSSSVLSIAPSHIVRVDMGRLDDLMRILGELVVHRSRMEERIARLVGDRGGLEEASLALHRSMRELRGAITRVRMVPIAEVFARMPFVVRDLAQEQGKRVRLAVTGQETEIDKYLVERLKEPLLHLVRNAISHGVEAAPERAAAGKAEEAVLALRAQTTGHAVIITVEDDGRGIDVAKVAARARSRGLPVPAAPNAAELLALLCQPGFSTRDEADLGSGRGVGMDVVHTTMRELGGVLTLETVAGRHTRFVLRLPLTLSIIDTFIVSVDRQSCAVPRALVEEIVQFEESEVRSVKQTEVIPYKDGVLPITRLSRFLGLAPTTRTRVPALVLAGERGLTGLVVDRVHAHREVVVRPMADPLLQVPGVAGATELGDGRPILVIDPTALTAGAVRPRDTLSAASS